MSGWGCRYQVNDDCVLLRRPCTPGVPGCVLYGKVCFIRDVDAASPKRAKPNTARVKRHRPAIRPGGKPK